MSEIIKLVSQEGPTSIYIDARIGEQGELLLSGQDLGEAPQAIFGKSDYEYFLRVSAADKDRVLLALIEKVYRGNSSTISEFKEFLESKKIPSQSYSF